MGNTGQYNDISVGMRIDLLMQGTNTGEAAGETFISIENLLGSTGDDTVLGDNGVNTLWGFGGNDSIFGRDGNDTLLGDAGDDILTGGAGVDSYNGGADSDTVSYEDFATGITVDLLTPAANTGEAAGETFISIKNLAGTTGADIILGDNIANVLSGSGGADTLTGRDGDDTLIGGADVDAFEGDAGFDTVDYSEFSSGFRIDLLNSAPNTGEAAGETYASIENVVGSDGNDDIFGMGGDDTLNGDDGDDSLDGGAGADTLNGGLGVNTASYLSASSLVHVDLSNSANNAGDAFGDTYVDIQQYEGSVFEDLLIGDANSNTLLGDSGADVLRGGDGDDFLFGGDDDDELDGGAGTNTASYASASTGTVVEFADTSLNAREAAGDVYINIQNLRGSAFADQFFADSQDNVMWGENGADRLFGRGGNDTLNGGNDNDTLDGGFGNDVYNGGAGSDIFIFDRFAATETVEDFDALDDDEDIDLIDLAMVGAITDFADLSANHLTQVSNDVLISSGAANITLENVLITDLHDEDFLFM
jgi:Ca2+-binding RTX toxin-like protein